MSGKLLPKDSRSVKIVRIFIKQKSSLQRSLFQRLLLKETAVYFVNPCWDMLNPH